MDNRKFDNELISLKKLVHQRIEMYLKREMIDVVAALREVESEIEAILEKPSTYEEMILRSKIPKTFFEVGFARRRAEIMGLETYGQLVALSGEELTALLSLTDRSLEKVENKLAQVKLKLREE